MKAEGGGVRCVSKDAVECGMLSEIDRSIDRSKKKKIDENIGITQASCCEN